MSPTMSHGQYTYGQLKAWLAVAHACYTIDMVYKLAARFNLVEPANGLGILAV